MNYQNTNPNRSRIAALILGFVFFVIGGWSIVLFFPDSTRGYPLIIPIISLFTLLYIYLLIKYLISPKKFATDQIVMEQALDSNPLGKAVSVSLNAWNVDIEVFKIIFTKFQLFLPFLLSIVVIFALIIIPLATGSFGRMLAYFYQNNFNPYIFFPIIIWVLSFVCCSVFVLGYISLGYVLRNKYLNVSESISLVFVRYFKLFGFVLLLSFTWFIIILLYGSGKKEKSSGLVVKSIVPEIFRVFKLFVYMNIVRVSLGDEKSSFKGTYGLIKENTYQMLRVWFGSGLLVSGVFFIAVLLLVIGTKFGIIPVTETSKGIVAPIFLGSLVFIAIFRAFAEQIGLFDVYMKDKHNISI
jgi:hypothetical protein